MCKNNGTSSEILKEVAKQLNEVQEILEYPESFSGGLMVPSAALEINIIIGKTIDLIKRHQP